MEKLSKNDPKYIICLKFLNKILENSNKSQILDILDFKEVTRQEILLQQNLDYLLENEEEMYKHFNKVRCGFYRKSDNYVINFLRGALKQLGYKPVRNEKDTHVNINGINYRKKIVYFHVE
jgi:hypothetical protein